MGRGVTGHEHWEIWWKFNKEAFLVPRNDALRTRSSEHFGSTRSGLLPDAVVEAEIVPLLRKLLRARQPEVRNAAAIALARAGRTGVAASLLPLVGDEDEGVRKATVLALGIAGGGTAELISIARAAPEARRALREAPPPELRGMALIALGLTGDEAAVEPLLEALSLCEESPDLPASAAFALGILDREDERIVPALLGTLDRGSRCPVVVRAHAANALGKIYASRRERVPEPVSTSLERALAGDEVEVRRSAAVALGLTAERGGRGVQRLLHAYHNDRDWLVRHYSALALGQAGDGSCRTPLETGLGQREPEARAYAAIALGLLSRSAPAEDEAGRNSMARVLEAFEAERLHCAKGAMAIAMALGGYGPSSGAIEKALFESPSLEFRGLACEALGLLGAVEARGSLEELVRTSAPWPEIQNQAAIGLALLGIRPPVATLVRALRGSDAPWVVGPIGQALGSIGDRSAVGALARIAGNQGHAPLSRALGVAALGMLGDGRAPSPLLRAVRDLNYRARIDPLADLLAAY